MDTSQIVYTESLTLNTSDEDVGVIFEEPHTRHRHAGLESIHRIGERESICRESRRCRVHGSQTVDIPYVETVVTSYSIQADGELALRVESHSLAGP